MFIFYEEERKREGEKEMEEDFRKVHPPRAHNGKSMARGGPAHPAATGDEIVRDG